jgi:hypothetical protein
MWNYSSVWKRVRVYGQYYNGLRGAEEKRFYDIIKEEDYKKDEKDIPTEFIIPFVNDAPLDTFSFMTVCIMNDGFKADVTITPVYSSPLTY